MSGWDLPEAVMVGGKMYRVNTDFRDVLDIIDHLTDPNDSEMERWYIAMALFYEDFAGMPQSDYSEAMNRLAAFIDGGTPPPQNRKPPRRLMDWQQDAAMIASGVNKVAGCDVRGLPYLHWYTFLGYFSAMGEGALSTVVGIRNKLQSHKPLEKWEREYYRDHKAEVDLQERLSDAETAEKQRLEALLSRKKNTE